MYSKHMERYSTSLVIREMQVNYHNESTSYPLDGLRFKNAQQVLVKMRRNEPSYTLVGMGTVQSVWKTIWQFLKGPNTELPYTQKFHLGVHPREMKTYVH